MNKLVVISSFALLLSGCVEGRTMVNRGAIYDPYHHYVGPTFYTPTPVIIKHPYHYNRGWHKGHRYPHRLKAP